MALRWVGVATLSGDPCCRKATVLPPGIRWMVGTTDAWGRDARVEFAREPPLSCRAAPYGPHNRSRQGPFPPGSLSPWLLTAAGPSLAGPAVLSPGPFTALCLVGLAFMPGHEAPAIPSFSSGPFTALPVLWPVRIGCGLAVVGLIFLIVVLIRHRQRKV